MDQRLKVSHLGVIAVALAATLAASQGCKTTGLSSGTKGAEIGAVSADVTDTSKSIHVLAGQPKTLLVVFPGAYVPSEKYTDLAKQIVATSNGSIGVFIPHFTANFANPLQAGPAVQEAIDYVSKQGVAKAASRVFIAGHSQGGIAANDMPLSYHLGGLILLGSYLPHTAVIGKQLKTYSAPVLTLGGELDGLTGINYLAREYATMADLQSSNANVLCTVKRGHFKSIVTRVMSL